MLHYLLCASLGPKALVSVLLKELADEADELIAVLDGVGRAIREDDFGVTNLAHQYLLVAVEERSHTDQHLVDEHADGPPVDREIVARPVHHLRSDVLRSAAV